MSVLGLIFASLLLAALGGAAWAGYQAGLTDREVQAEATQAADLRVQFDLGAADLAAQRFQMAATRFEYVLARDPEYPAARANLEAAQAGLHVTATPPPPTAVPIVDADPAQMLAAAEAYAAAGNWDAVIEQVARLRVADPGYELLQADHLIFTALRGRGVTRIQGDLMEAGIFDLDQAGQFGSLDADARNLRAWARLYLAAKSFYGLDWPKTVDILSQLYVLAPNFKDTAQLLRTAALQYATQLDAAGQPCLAAEQYARAHTLAADPAVAEALTMAQAACALVPTPTAADPNAPTPTP